MPSLICRWEGSCLDPRIQGELTAFTAKLAECNWRRWEGLEIPRPDFLRVPREEAERRARETELVREFHGPIAGRIMIEPKLALFEELTAGGSVRAQHIEGPADWNHGEGEASCVAYSADREEWLAFTPPPIELHGVDFRLYDPRGLYPGEDRVSFLFARCPHWPALDGKIVAAESHVQCQQNDNALVRAADWLIARPSIHLRYYLEEWFDLLLSWVKRFFVADLYYWRGEELNQYTTNAQMMDELCSNGGAAAATQAVFENLVDRFQEEADQWSENVVRMALGKISLGPMEAESEEVDAVKSENEFRCGTCGPQFDSSALEPGKAPSIRELIQQLYSQHFDRQLDAVKGLIAAGPENYVFVVKALTDPRLEDLREDVFLELANVREPALPMARTVAKHLDARTMPIHIRATAAYALSRMGGQADAAIHAWMEETPRTAWESLRSHLFSMIGEERSVEFLRTAMRSRQGDRIDWAFETVATDITHPWEALIPDIVAAISAATHPLMRAAAVDALIGIGEPAVDSMWTMAESPRPEIRVTGLEALGRYAAPHPGARVRWINVGGREPLALLVDKLGDIEPTVRVAAAVALQKIAVAISMERLVSEMAQADPDLQVTIAEGYRECIVNQGGDQRLRDRIRGQVEELTGHLINRRRLAAVDLVVSPDTWPDGSSPLHSALLDWEDPHKEEYLEAIRLAGPRAKGLMEGIVLCTAASPPIQVAALKALATMREHVNEAAVDRAIVCLEASHLEVRQAAASALGDFSGPKERETVIALRRALLDDDRGVGFEACAALGKKRKLAADAVSEIAARVERLGETAVEALGQIGTPEARAEMLILYRRLAGTIASQDESEYSEYYECMSQKARRWLEKWEILPPAGAG